MQFAAEDLALAEPQISTSGQGRWPYAPGKRLLNADYAGEFLDVVLARTAPCDIEFLAMIPCHRSPMAPRP